MKKIYLISTIILFVATVIFVLFVNFYPKTQNGKNGDIIEKKGIEIFSPKANEVILSPLKIAGSVNGDGWNVFEGQVGTIKLFGSNNKELATGILTAQGEWMQIKIDFETELNFIVPEDDQGTLIFYNENPSGETERNRTFVLPVKFK